MVKEYMCLVCGYIGLIDPPYDERGYGSYEICQCCGFQFGYDDDVNKEESINNWRVSWINNGFKWFSRSRTQPGDWNPEIQLKIVVKK